MEGTTTASGGSCAPTSSGSWLRAYKEWMGQRSLPLWLANPHWRGTAPTQQQGAAGRAHHSPSGRVSGRHPRLGEDKGQPPGTPGRPVRYGRASPARGADAALTPSSSGLTLECAPRHSVQPCPPRRRPPSTAAAALDQRHSGLAHCRAARPCSRTDVGHGPLLRTGRAAAPALPHPSRPSPLRRHRGRSAPLYPRCATARTTTPRDQHAAQGTRHRYLPVPARGGPAPPAHQRSGRRARPPHRPAGRARRDGRRARRRAAGLRLPRPSPRDLVPLCHLGEEVMTMTIDTDLCPCCGSGSCDGSCGDSCC